MKQGHDRQGCRPSGVSAIPSCPGWAGRAGLVLGVLMLVACAGPRAPAPISHRAATPAVVPPAPAPAVEQATQGAEVETSAIASSAVEASPILGEQFESRPLGGSVPLPAAAAGGEVRGEPSGVKRPYSDEAYARLAAAPTQGKRPVSGTAAAAGSAARPATGSTAQGKFAWPVRGRLLQRFSDPASMGIAIEAAAGTPVQAAEAGRVIFAGNGPRGYGNLVIIKHDDELLSVYAHNRKLLVKEGDRVTRGQRIAEVGATGTDSARLGFEVRRQGKPIDPLQFLAGD